MNLYYYRCSCKAKQDPVMFATYKYKRAINMWIYQPHHEESVNIHIHGNYLIVSWIKNFHEHEKFVG